MDCISLTETLHVMDVPVCSMYTAWVALNSSSRSVCETGLSIACIVLDSAILAPRSSLNNYQPYTLWNWQPLTILRTVAEAVVSKSRQQWCQRHANSGVKVMPTVVPKSCQQWYQSHANNGVKVTPTVLSKSRQQWCQSHANNGVKVTPTMVSKSRQQRCRLSVTVLFLSQPLWAKAWWIIQQTNSSKLFEFLWHITFQTLAGGNDLTHANLTSATWQTAEYLVEQGLLFYWIICVLNLYQPAEMQKWSCIWNLQECQKRIS